MKKNRVDVKELQKRARLLRRQASDTEMLLWQRLRARRMCGFKFRRQMVIGQYIVDFVCLEALLVIEADGGQHAEQKTYDDKRTRYLRNRGFQVLRFWNHEIFINFNSVLETIENVLNHSPSSPQPSPQRGEGVR